MTFFQRLQMLFLKESQARIALSVNQVGKPVNSPANYEAYSAQGYQKNVIAYRCISMIAKSCAGISWCLYDKRGKNKVELETHPLLTLIYNPNPMQGQSAFFESLVAYFNIAGNTYIELNANSVKAPPTELWTVRPDKMRIVPNSMGYPGKFVFEANSQTRTWDVDPFSFKSNIIHMKAFHPRDIWYGMSPMEAALISLDQNNAAQRWNLSLLQNQAIPSGIMKVQTTTANPRGEIKADAIARIRQEFDEKYSGPKNAGRPMILEGGLDWTQTSFSPNDMQFIENKKVTSSDICKAFGVPEILLGLGQMTFKNYEEARLSFYEETILPTMDFIKGELNRGLTPRFDSTGRLELDYDKDDIEALEPKRREKFKMMNDAQYIKINEKREAVGYDADPNGDVYLINGKVISNLMSVAEDNIEEPEEEVDVTPELPEAPESPEEIEAPMDEEKSMEYKVFNILNRDERLKTYRRVNAKRKKLEGAMQRDLRADFKELAKELDQAAKGKEPRVAEIAMLKVSEEFMPVLKRTIKRHLKYAVEDFGNVVFNEAKSLNLGYEIKANTRKWDSWAKQYIETRTGNAISEVEGTTQRKIRATVKRLVEEAVVDGRSDQDIALELEDTFDGMSAGRARTIARTEVGIASNNATLEAVKALEVPNMQKEWASILDDRTRDGGDDGNGPDHYSMDGVRVGLDEKFTVPPDTSMEGPGDPSAGADQLCNCRCTMLFKIGKE